MPKILLVEDNELNLDMLSRRLRRKGYDVVTAVDGQEGLEKAESEAPDLIRFAPFSPAAETTLAKLLRRAATSFCSAFRDEALRPDWLA